MNSYIWVEIKTSNRERFFLRCRGLEIFIYETREKNEILEVKILESDFPKLKKIWFIKPIKKEFEGLRVVKGKVKKNQVFLIMVVFGLFFLFCLSNVIVSVNVIHSNKEIRDIVTSSLEDYGIRKNTWKKSYKELEKIKETILNTYPEKLEWLEIEQKGMTYVVRVEERKIKEEETPKEACNIVAMKDGIIREMIYSKGEALYKKNDSVKEGDILISGIIKKDEEEKGVVCATGEVYAEVWYQVNVSVPMNYEKLTPTGKVRWNLKLKNNGYHDFIFRSRLEKYTEESNNLFTIFGNTLSFVKQHEVNVEVLSYTEEEALSFALSSVDEKISSTLGENEEILVKKVLKKERNDSTMNVEVFVSVQEAIGQLQEFEKNRSGDDNDSTTNGSN